MDWWGWVWVSVCLLFHFHVEELKIERNSPSWLMLIGCIGKGQGRSNKSIIFFFGWLTSKRGLHFEETHPPKLRDLR